MIIIITIMITIIFTDRGSYARIISNPTPENLSEFILRGERQTWPSVGIIRSQCEVGKARIFYI